MRFKETKEETVENKESEETKEGEKNNETDRKLEGTEGKERGENLNNRNTDKERFEAEKEKIDLARDNIKENYNKQEKDNIKFLEQKFEEYKKSGFTEEKLKALEYAKYEIKNNIANEKGSVTNLLRQESAGLQNVQYLKENPVFRESKNGTAEYTDGAKKYIDTVKTSLKCSVKHGDNLGAKEEIKNSIYQNLYDAYDNLGSSRSHTMNNRRL